MDPLLAVNISRVGSAAPSFCAGIAGRPDVLFGFFFEVFYFELAVCMVQIEIIPVSHLLVLFI